MTKKLSDKRLKTLLKKTAIMPDVAVKTIVHKALRPLQKVGMSHIQMPVFLEEQGKKTQVSAKVSAFVSLDALAVRGIHMSRLYREVQDKLTQNALSEKLLAQILEGFLESHTDISQSAEIQIRFDQLIQRQALKSGLSGWRSYPILWAARLERGQKPQFFLQAEVLYSSTCPASAALARQLTQENFQQHFHGQKVETASVHEWLGRGDGELATPHAQRSLGKVVVQAEKSGVLHAVQLIDRLEKCLATPVQSLVKREDEQEFTRLNGENLMFCEDAARRVQAELEAWKGVVDYAAQFIHEESLHPHNAVAQLSKSGHLQLF